jgi:transposase InsO family protein
MLGLDISARAIATRCCMPPESCNGYASTENTECLVHCFSQAVARRGLPRLLHNDNGSAMIAGEFVQGLDRLHEGAHVSRG